MGFELLARFKPLKCPKCFRNHWISEKPQGKYLFLKILVGETVIMPWENATKAYTYATANNYKCCIRQHADRANKKFVTDRHLAGLKVTRVQ